MQLRRARLCLDCEELHEEAQCPACASEAFVYLTRWIPVDDLRSRKRARPRPTAQPRVSHIVKGGAMGLAMLAAARWLLRAPSATESTPAAARDRDGGAAGPETSGDGE
ncbi:MAG: hypothetical protein AB7N65_03370 [Vicinamibacterales bacterium]